MNIERAGVFVPMNGMRIGLLGIVALGAIGAWLAATRPSQPDAVAEAIAREDPPTVSASAGEAPSPPAESLWVPSGRACHHPTSVTSIGDLSNAFLAALVVDGYDARTKRFPLSQSDASAYVVRDCRGDRIEIDHPLTPEELKQPSHAMLNVALPDVDASAGGPARVDRYDVRGSRIAVFVTVGAQGGYYFWCNGFAAIIRLDPGDAVVEGVSALQLDGCNERGQELHLTPLDGHAAALLLPVDVSTGEDKDLYESAWSVSVPDHGALRAVGDVRSRRGPGGRSASRGNSVDSMEGALLLDSGSLEVEETWQRVRYDAQGNKISGAKRTLLRTYTLEDGGLVRSPSADPITP
jgi:hypothetical protein